MKLGVLVMAYGSPNNLDDIEPFYTDIRRGRKPTPELLEELTDRYKMIGGSSPLLRVTNEQANSTEEKLGNDLKVYVGMRHWTPWVAEAIEEMKNDGITHAVGIVMAPHYSTMSIAKYIECVDKGQAKHESNIDFKYVTSWHDHPLFIDAMVEMIVEAQPKFTKEELDSTHYIFTAHSLPERILLENDPYKNQLLETCELINEKLGGVSWSFAFQSAGRTEEKWLGPDIREEINQLNSEKNIKNILVCSIGFIVDHLEVIYDIDIEAQELAHELDIKLVRARTLNNHPNLSTLFAQLIDEQIKSF
jgi:ferrochelatase